jgi:hypothetical protein
VRQYALVVLTTMGKNEIRMLCKGHSTKMSSGSSGRLASREARLGYWELLLLVRRRGREHVGPFILQV